MLSNSKLALAWLCVMLLLAVALGQQLFFQRSNPIETNILALLPENRQDPVAQQAFDHVAKSMSNKVIFLLGSDDAGNMLAAADAFDSALHTSPLFSKITAKVPVDTQQAWGELYFPKRFQLLTADQKARLTRHPEQQTQYVIQSLYNPFSGVTGQELASDPFLLFRDYLSQLTKQTGNFSLNKGYLTTQYQGKQFVLISADLADSPYSYQLQQQLPALLNIEQGIRDTYKVELLHTGVVFYAEHGTESAKSEISTIGVGSLVGVILLLLLVYRSPLPLALALLSIGCGLLAAFVGTVAIFGKVHLFSLVFGASLIGVSIDYAFHFLTDRLAAGNSWHANKGLKQIFTAITLGLITSLIGYLGMLIAPFPGLQQLSLFSAIGLVAAYATVVCWYPVLAAKPSQSRSLPLTRAMHAWLALWQQPLFRKGLPTLLLSLALVGLYHVEYNDDIRQLQALPQELKQQEDTIKAITGLSSSQQMLVVTANDQQQLLQNLESVSNTLTQFQHQGVLKGFQSISQYLPSEKTQRQNHELIQHLYQQQGAVLAQSLPTAGQAKLEHDFSPLTIAQFIDSPVSEPLRFLWLGKLANQQHAAIIMLSDVAYIAPIIDFAEQSATVSYLNKADEVSALFGEYRVRVTELLIAASLVIMAVLWWRYDFTRAVRLMLPPVIAGIVGIGVTSLTGVPLNLFNLLALILILGIGIDYTLFFAEQHQADTTLLSITLSAMTTLLSFGLLALSQTQAIHSFGITVLTGIMVAWLLAPLSMSPANRSSSTKEHNA